MTDPEKNTKPKSFFSFVNKQATLRGSVNSTINNTMRGANAITTATDQFKKETRAIMQPGRVESFSQAMKRLGIKEAKLPLIHNQILLQLYLTFFLAIVAFTVALQFIIQAMWMPAMLASMVGLTCLANFAQSSIRAYQVRNQRLGAASQWLTEPGQWLPARMANLERMENGDPLRHPLLLNNYSSKARFHMFIAAFFLGLGLCLYFISFRLVPMAFVALCFLLSIAFVVYGSWFSFEVFRRRKALHCDMLFWLSTPSAWVPLLTRPTVKSNAKKEPRDGA